MENKKARRVLIGGKLQRFSELWESSRSAKKEVPMNSDDSSPTGDEITTDEEMEEQSGQKTIVPDLSLFDRERTNGVIRVNSNDHSDGVNGSGEDGSDTPKDNHHEVRPADPDVEVEDCSNDPEDHMCKALESKQEPLPSKPITPAWLANAFLMQQTQAANSKGNDGAASKWCSSCKARIPLCSCANILQKTSPPSELQPARIYPAWLMGAPVVTYDQHPEGSLGEVAVANGHGSSSGARYKNETIHWIVSEKGRRRRAMAPGGESQQKLFGHRLDGCGGVYHADGRDQEINIAEFKEIKLKTKTLTHPLFPQMLAAHVACLRACTPIDQLPMIDEHLSNAQAVIDQHTVRALKINEEADITGADLDELDFAIRTYTMMLVNLQFQLQHYLRIHTAEAMLACSDLEQKLRNLTGVAPWLHDSTVVSDDDEEQTTDGEGNEYDTGSDVQDNTPGYGPVAPTDSERSLMERVRRDLKAELTVEGYRKKIIEVREEILRKRRAGKLPEGTTSILKTWWNNHAKWPYPTEEEKEYLIQETGLELKQVNNWFINQRKRNWHNNPLSPNVDLKHIKRKV